MIPTDNLPEYSAIVIVMIFLIKEMFSFLKVRKLSKNGNGTYQVDMAAVNLKLDNHLADFNKKMGKMVERMGNIEGGMTEMKMDVKIVKNAMNDIKIKLK